MLSFLTAIVELVDMRDGQVLFRSNKDYEVGRQVSVRMVLPPGSGKIATITVTILSSRPLEGGGTLYVSRLNEEILAQFSGDVQDKALRRASRHNLGIRVMSRQLPGFRGMTVDLSRTGLQLELEGPVTVGEGLDLKLEFDRFDLTALACEAEVRWCRAHPERDGVYRAGVQFNLEDPRVRAAIDRVADFFEARAHSDLERLLAATHLVDTNHQTAPPPTLPSSASGPQPAPLPAQGRPTADPGPQVPSVSAPPERRKARRTTFVIPVDATIIGHRWELRDRRLVLSLRDKDGQERRLEFPDCQTLRDHGCAFGITAKSLRTCSDSPLLDWAMAREEGIWKHYQFLDLAQDVILEIVSAPCRPG